LAGLDPATHVFLSTLIDKKVDPLVKPARGRGSHGLAKQIRGIVSKPIPDRFHQTLVFIH
jgi:hypothetical protein